MSDWERLAGILDFCAVYYSMQIIWCAAISFAMTGFVLFCRKICFSKRIFLKGMVWSCFLVVPFLGRLRLYYEDPVVCRLTGWLMHGMASCRWAGHVYMAGIAAAAFIIFGKRIRLSREISRMRTVMFQGKRIYITEMNVTPFTAGLARAKIVLPKVMLDSCQTEELKVMIQHEKTHIRSGHLWFGFVWDVLRCLFWINPFLTICQKYIRADLEDICDRICIQKSGISAYEYGRILLKSVKLLRCGQEPAPPAVTFAGENGWADLRRRMGNIAAFCPVRRLSRAGMAAGNLLAVLTVLWVVQIHSYAQYTESRDIMVFQYDKEPVAVSYDTEYLGSMISYDDSYVYVDREAFEQFLSQNQAQGDIYIVFGGYFKLPGIGGQAEACVYEPYAGADKKQTIRIAYESISRNPAYLFYKLM